MKSAFAILIALCLSACEDFDYTATAQNGNTEHLRLRSFGGSQSTETAGGTRHTSNHNKTAGQAFQFLTAVAGGVANSVNVGHVEHTAQVKDTNNAGVLNNAANQKGQTDRLQITTNGATEAAKIQKQ